MGIHAIHHKAAPAMPINTSGDYCRAGCWTPPGREHGLACPAVTHRRLAHPDAARIFAGLLVGLPIGAALWTALVFLIGAIA